MIPDGFEPIISSLERKCATITPWDQLCLKKSIFSKSSRNFYRRNRNPNDALLYSLYTFYWRLAPSTTFHIQFKT